MKVNEKCRIQIYKTEKAAHSRRLDGEQSKGKIKSINPVHDKHRSSVDVVQTMHALVQSPNVDDEFKHPPIDIPK
jgi:hypothetical protein